MKRGGKVMNNANEKAAAVPPWHQAQATSQELRDLRDKVRNLETDLELTEHQRQRDAEYIKIVEAARSDAEYGLAYTRAELSQARDKVKALQGEKGALEVHVEGARAEINAAVIVLKIIRGLRPSQGKDKRGIVDKLVSRLEFYAKHLGK